jgi:hypothetical protein
MENHSRAATQPTPEHKRRAATKLGEFVRVSRLFASGPSEEWMTKLPDGTEVVVPASAGGPSPLGVEKAVAIVQSRWYLEKRAIQLIAPFRRGEGGWQLLTIDFGAEARRRDSEFLMCFAFMAANTTVSIASPYFEVGFALPERQQTEEPVFELTVKAVVGFPFQDPLP